VVDVDIERLREIIRLLKEEGLSEITLCEGENRITIRRAADRTTRAEQAATAPSGPPGAFALTAPLVGTFYRRSSPDEPPFVAPGATIAPGETVAIIEAMKVMNEIKAERPGRLLRVLAEEGAPVEYGQDLFLFEPV